MPGKFVAETGVVKGLVLNLEGAQEWIVGRAPDEATLIVEDPSVSRRHLLCRSKNGTVEVENLSETNPALLNGDLIEAPTELEEGDRIQLGNQELLFTFEEPPQVTQGEETPTPFMEEEEEGEEEEPSRDSVMGDEESSAGLTEVHFDLLETGRWVLKVVGGPNNGAEFSLQPGNSYTLGTDPTACDIVFHDISVSRQHARLNLTEDDKLTLEDLGSRNGTFLEDDKIEGRVRLETNKLVTLGTSTFVVLDVEGERNTIISPLLPSIVKVLQKEEKKQGEEGEGGAPGEIEEKEKKPPFSLLGAFILIALVSGLFAVIGIGLSSLFYEEETEKQAYDYDTELSEIVSQYPAVRYSFNEGTGRLLLIGHVLTAVDRGQLVYTLQALPFVKSIDDNIIIDEYVWRELNQVLARNPDWKGVSLISPVPGRYILSGYLQSKKQGESLTEYINQNFSYPDLLENKVVVEEDLLSRVSVILRNNGLANVTASFSDGEIRLVGTIPQGTQEQLGLSIQEIKKLNGVRNVQAFITEQRPSESIVNLTDKYTVSGISDQGGMSISVVINGRILTVGDVLDGMTITEIRPNEILLEKGSVKYKIDYNK